MSRPEVASQLAVLPRNISEPSTSTSWGEENIVEVGQDLVVVDKYSDNMQISEFVQMQVAD